MRRLLSYKAGKRSSPEISFAYSFIMDFYLQNYKKINSCCISHSGYSILLQHPNQTITVSFQGSKERKRCQEVEMSAQCGMWAKSRNIKVMGNVDKNNFHVVMGIDARLE